MPRRRQDDLHTRLARLGASARLDEIRREEAAIRAAYPELFGARRGRPAATAGGGGRKRRGMSAAARKAVSERMRRYWADRRKKEGRSK